MAQTSKALNEIIQPAVVALGYEFVGCECLSQGHGTLLRVYVDSKDGIGLDEIAKVSRQISAVLDVADPISGHYNLEVSSPGLNRPLFSKADYERFVGQQIKLRLRTPKDGQRNFKGVLIEVIDQQIKLKTDDGETVEFALPEIEKANLVPEL